MLVKVILVSTTNNIRINEVIETQKELMKGIAVAISKSLFFLFTVMLPLYKVQELHEVED